MSWPVFLEPPSDQVVGPLPQLVNEENPARYKTKKYSDYVYCKLNKIPQQVKPMSVEWIMYCFASDIVQHSRTIALFVAA